MKFGRSVWALVAMIWAADQARAQVDLTMEVTTTAMTVAAPELQVLIRNEGNEVGSYKLQIVGAKHGAVPACDLKNAPPDDSQPGNPWREFLIGGVSGSVAPHGFAHRIHAFRNRNASACAVAVQLSWDASSQQRVVTIRPPAAVKPTAIEPKVSAYGWAERDIMAGPLLVHVIARNESTAPQTLVVLRREISCKDPGPVSWSLLRDVPQGLSAGPAVAPGKGWVGFVSVVELPVRRPDLQCTASFDIAYERMPRGYVVIEKVDVALQENSGWSWWVPAVEWPKE